MARKRGIESQQVVAAAATIADAEGLAAVTLARVAAALDVASPSLYSHVDGVAGLRRALALRAAAGLAAALSTGIEGRVGVDALRTLAHAYRAFAIQHPGQYAAIDTTPSQADDDELFAALAASVPAITAVLTGLGLPASDAVPVIRTLRSALHGFVMLEASGGFGLPGDIDQSFDVLVDTVIAGIAARAGGRVATRGQRRPAPLTS
jgi:AcrR family transcriptional regulator